MNDGPLARLARFCYRRRRLVLAAWLAGAIAVIALGFGFAAPADNGFSGGNSGAARAQDLIGRHFPARGGDTLTLAIRANGGLDAARPRVERVIGELSHSPHVISVSSPYQTPGQVSPDRKTAFASVQLDTTADGMPTGDVTPMISDVRAASGDGVTFALGGGAVINAETPPGGPTEGVGLLAAVVVLLIAFGSLLAMGLPILTAIFGIGTGLAGIELLGHLLPAPSFTSILAGLIGLGVGVDYALFIVTRYREALAGGQEPEEATVTAIATAGRAVLFAGTTVVIALLGLFVMRQRLLDAVAVAASLTVAMTMVTAVTLLPALLGFTGRRIDRFRLPMRRRPDGHPLSARWAETIQRRPVAATLASALVLLALGAPALSMRLGFPDSSTQSHGTSGYQSHRILADGFGPGYDAPLVVVVTPPGGAAAVVAAARKVSGVASVTPARTSPDGGIAMFVAYPATGLQDAATPALVRRLRGTLPAADAAAGARVYVGGPNAATIDFADTVVSRLPWLIAVVVGLSLVLLLVLVRSVAIAVKAAVMNLLSITAAYGVLTVVVQWGWLGHALGFPTAMPVAAWVPLFMFPILFGLSTDYEVFLISRVREEYDLGAPTRAAVTRGLARTARVITAAAAIMVCVFLSTLLGADVAVKQIGLGMGVAVLVDATIVRMILVPAVMELLGAANWWLPRPLARLLPSAEPVPAVAARAAADAAYAHGVDRRF